MVKMLTSTFLVCAAALTFGVGGCCTSAPSPGRGEKAPAAGEPAKGPAPAAKTPAPAAKAPEAPVALVPLEIKNSGAPVKDLGIDAPAGARFEEKFTNTLVTKGDRFQLLIGNRKTDMKELKAAHASPDGTMKAKKYDVDAPDALLFEGEMFGETGYHVEVNVKVGPTNFTCTDWRKPGASYSKAEAETMLKACRSLRKK